ncbi:hypothetical protein HRbin02_00667 [Candidatus Calditenuaceae archaeon HR02]|nr:hypothetical protein HRbin02_00667 [Candidatus Calditenuaceae archaeon HR02]
MTPFKNSAKLCHIDVERGIDLIVKPPLRRAAIEAITVIGSGGYEAVFLNLPRSLQPYIPKLAEEGDVEAFMEEAKEATQLPENYLKALLRGHETFFKLLPRVSSGREIICYSPNPTHEEIRATLELPALILRDTITETISLERWLSLIEEMIESTKNKLREEAAYLLTETRRFRHSACICNPEAAVNLKKHLQKKAPTHIIYTALPYAYTPLQILLRLYQQKPVPASQAEKHIKQHLKFIQKHVIPQGLDQAIENWTTQQLKWLTDDPQKHQTKPQTTHET